MTNLSGHTLGRYHIIEQLGEGGMATVYRAHDTRLERDVAIKVIRTELFGTALLERILKRFEREAKALAQLSHPHIIKVIDYGEFDGIPFLVMEYMPGGTLRQKLGRPIPWQAAFRLLIPIAQALEMAHRQGLVHRDVKPSNILLTNQGQPMLTDFGIAKILDLDDATSLTGTGVGVGTPEYMAPEQWTNKTSIQSDIYGLGVVLYELITGHKPYTADTPAAILLKQANDPLPRPTEFVPTLPEQVERILIKALAKKPENRFANMLEFAGAMQALLNERKWGDGTVQAQPDDGRTLEQTEPMASADELRTINQPRTAASGMSSSARPVDVPSNRHPAPANPRKNAGLWIAGSAFALLICLAGIAIASSLPGSEVPTPAVRQPPTSTSSLHATATYASLLTELASAEETGTAMAVEQSETATSMARVTDTPVVPTKRPTTPPVPMFTAIDGMFCREGPSTSYDAPWQLNSGETVPVIGVWYLDSNWILVDINEPDRTRTDCCWVSGNGNLNVSLNSLKSISSIPDRKNCSSVK